MRKYVFKVCLDRKLLTIDEEFPLGLIVEYSKKTSSRKSYSGFNFVKCGFGNDSWWE